MIPQKKTIYHVFKMGIFSKLFVAVMAQMIIENAEKNRVTYYLFSIKNRGYTLVIFFMGQSLFTLNRYYMRTKKSIMIHFRSWLDFIQKTVCWTLLNFYVQFTCLFLFQFHKQTDQFWIPYGLPFAFQNWQVLRKKTVINK